ncbi:PH domain-containing protein [Candidatus Hodarchaeum mangrovi]
MKSKEKVIVIRGDGKFPPPTEIRRIRPSRRLLWKYYLDILLVWIGILTFSFIIPQVFNYLVRFDSNPDSTDPLIINLIITVIWIIGVFGSLIALILLPYYVNEMEFIVHGDFITVKKGIINKTVKHVPYRGITNISTVAGPLDRIFDMGCVYIETAARSGTSNKPEEILEGLILYHEIRDYILRRLQAFRPSIVSNSVILEPDKLLEEKILMELRDLKEKFRNIGD